MRVVIDITEYEWEYLNKLVKNGDILGHKERLIVNGIPLPKGHGRLIDVDKLEPRDISPEAWYSPMWGFELVDIEDAPTIIEADRESEVEE